MGASQKHTLKLSPLSDKLRVVLVEPGTSRNVGSVLRAMSNFGFSRIFLVAPRNFSPEEASVTACWAANLLESLIIVDDLASALHEVEDVVGFTCSYGKNRPSHTLSQEWITSYSQEAKNTALVFGPEENGLRSEHLEHCRTLLRIPTATENPSLNLSQAVLIALYEISKLNWPQEDKTQSQEYATWEDLYQLDKLVVEAGEKSGFFTGKSTPAVRSIVKNIFRRSAPDKREVNILLGLFSGICKKISQA